MNTRTQQISRFAAATLGAAVGAAALLTLCTLVGCSGAGQSEVTETDRPAEGEGWAVQEDMAR